MSTAQTGHRVSLRYRLYSAFCIAVTMTVGVVTSFGSSANAQDRLASPTAAGQPLAAAVPAIDHQPIQAEIGHSDAEAIDGDSGVTAPGSLAELVDATPLPETPSREIGCLAGAIYFEAKSETLAGQLAVGRVIVARSHSGRFPDSYCGVVYQPSQFSFIRRHSIASVDHGSRAWQQAVKIAVIADRGSWKSKAEGAMYFHAARVSPAWGHERVARIDNHVFYR